MYLSRRTSLVIAVSALVLFFIVASIFLVLEGRAKTIPSSSTLQAATPSTPTIAINQNLITPSNDTATKLDTNFSLKEFHRSETKDGKKLWEIFGAEGQFLPQENAVQISKARVNLYKSDNEQIDVRADKAKVFLLGAGIGKAELESNVVITLNQVNTLKTEALVFDKTNSSVFAPGNVKITTELMEITGQVLNGNMEKNVFELKKNVVSILKPRVKK